jgi:hypothetical protein
MKCSCKQLNLATNLSLGQIWKAEFKFYCYADNKSVRRTDHFGRFIVFLTIRFKFCLPSERLAARFKLFTRIFRIYRSDYQLKIFLQIGDASAMMTDCARSQV